MIQHASGQSWWPSADGSWSERLGLYFRDDCQEDTGLHGLLIWLISWVARHGQQRSGHCESKEMRCAAGSKVTGLQVRYARLEQGDRDLYDFKPRCGTSWQSWLGMRFPGNSEADLTEAEADICTTGTSVTGVQVMRGRNDRRDWDYYNFKLRCGKQWAEPLGLAFDGLRETRSATCPSGSSVAGLRVHRGFQDWGDLDTYEFQLFCTTPVNKEGRPEKASRGGGEKASRGGGGSAHSKADKGGVSEGKGTTKPRSTGKSKSSSGGGGRKAGSAFGSRAAEFEAAAAEVREEMRKQAEADARATNKDEL